MKRPYLLFVIFILAACGDRGPAVVVPTATPDPLAFFAPTPISPGRPENPLRIMFQPPTYDTENSTGATQQQAVTLLTQELSSRSGLAIEVVIADTQAEMLAALCEFNGGTAPWLSGPSAVLALERACGDVALVGVRDGRTRLAGEIVSASGVRLNSLNGRVFCRLGVGDFHTWILPSIAMESRGIDPLSIGEVDEYTTYELLFETVANGACAATGGPAGFLDTEYAGDVPPALIVTDTIDGMPYGVLFYPPEMLLGDRVALTDAFIEIAGAEAADTGDGPIQLEPVLVEVDGDQLTSPQQALLALMGADSVTSATVEDLADVIDFMANVGIQ